MALSDSLVSWVGIQHGSESTVGSLNLLDLKTNANQSFELPGRPGFAFPTSKENLFVVGCERSLGLFDLNDGSWNVLIDGVDAGVDNTIINDGWAIGSQLIFGTKDLEFATKKQDFIFIMALLMNLSNFDPTKSAAMEKPAYRRSGATSAFGYRFTDSAVGELSHRSENGPTRGCRGGDRFHR